MLETMPSWLRLPILDEATNAIDKHKTIADCNSTMNKLMPTLCPSNQAESDNPRKLTFEAKNNSAAAQSLMSFDDQISGLDQL